LRIPIRPWLACLALSGAAASAQTVIEARESVSTDSPEAWAMRYMAGTTLMTSYGETAALAPWRWNVALDLGHIPRLGDDQQQVGFGGSKSEDLNKSPVFGRLRVAVGLPHDWVGEIAYTPPLEIDGARARNVVALAVGRRLASRDGFTLSMRALGQAGKVEGDITCPARLAGVEDRQRNPYGCQSPSNDEFTANYYGVDATLGWASGPWSWHASAGIARTRLSVQVDANVFTVNDRTRLDSSGSLPWFTVGVRHAFDSRWSLAAEWLHVPLDVRRPPDFSKGSDPLDSLRVQLRYSPG
jgi:hypothetical protein